MLRVGHISYANCTPLFYALTKHHDCSNYIFVKGVPSELNSLLLKGEIDLSPSSSIELARHRDLYFFLPNLSISSFGRVSSIILFSRVPIEDLNHERIALTQASTTSSILLRIIMSEFLKKENTFHEEAGHLDYVLRRYKAFLLIGDDALKAVIGYRLQVSSVKQNSELFLYDLGELWYKFTDLPFVFALWLLRKDVLREKEVEVEVLLKSLLSAKEIAYRSFNEIFEEVDEKEWMTKDSLIGYWNRISYDLNNTHFEGLKEFYRYAEKLSLIEQMLPLESYIIPTKETERRQS
ncbi:MAG: menaquinone biosynthesis protein [Nitrospirota bacterium]